MIYYELDPITNEKSNLSDSTSKIEDDFSLKSRIEKIANSNKPSDVVFYCSRFKKEKYSNKKFDDENDKNIINQTELIYDENDITRIIQSLNEAEGNLKYEKEIDSVVNFFLMKEINPSKIENKMTPNLRLLKTDPLFRSYVDAKLLNYKPIKFDLKNFYISKHDKGVQSPEFLLKKSKNPKKLNNSVDTNKKYSFLQQNYNSKTKHSNETNDYKYYTPKKKQSFIFLSESDTENVNKSQEYDQKERISKDIEITAIPNYYKDSDSIKSKFSENDYYSSFYSSDIYSCSNYYSETQNEITKIDEPKKSKNHHRHHKHHHSKDIKNSKHHHSHHNKSNLSPSENLIEIEQESSSELKEVRKNKQNKPELLHLNIEDSLNMIIESSSTQSNVSNDYQLKKDDKKVSNFSIEDEDCFEIEFENEIEEEDEVE